MAKYVRRALIIIAIFTATVVVFRAGTRRSRPFPLAEPVAAQPAAIHERPALSAHAVDAGAAAR